MRGTGGKVEGEGGTLKVKKIGGGMKGGEGKSERKIKKKGRGRGGEVGTRVDDSARANWRTCWRIEVGEEEKGKRPKRQNLMVFWDILRCIFKMWDVFKDSYR